MSILGVVRQLWTNGKEATSQNPLPVDGDSVYVKDVNLDTSTSVDFTGGTVEDLFDSLTSTLTNSTANNPKTLIINMNRPIVTSGISIGDANGGTHSNVKIEALQGGTTYTTVNDSSAIGAAFESRFYSFSTTVGTDNIGVIGITGLRITFNTTSAVAVSFIRLSKAQDRITSIQGLKPSGTTTFIGATNNSNLNVSLEEFGDTAVIDAFARLRVSTPTTIFDSKQLHDKAGKFWDEILGGSATSAHSSTNAETAMTVTASASDYAARQTFQRFNYQPGKSQLAFMTFLAKNETGVKKRIGQFDGITGPSYMTPGNGVWFENDAGTLSFNIAKNGTTTETATQANWNIDKLDGTGRSGITLNMDATQIMIFDYEWLGVGRVRMGFVIDGVVFYAHEFNHANDDSFSSVYMSTPNNPLRYDIESDGTGGGSLSHICSTIMSEGGQEATGILRTINNGTTHVDANAADTAYACLGIRLKSTHLDISVELDSLTVIAQTLDDFLWRVLLNPTVAGTFTYADLNTDSAVQFATGATANTVTGGTEMASGYGAGNADITQELENAIRLGAQIDGTRDEIIISVTPLTSNADILASLNFRELL